MDHQQQPHPPSNPNPISISTSISSSNSNSVRKHKLSSHFTIEHYTRYRLGRLHHETLAPPPKEKPFHGNFYLPYMSISMSVPANQPANRWRLQVSMVARCQSCTRTRLICVNMYKLYAHIFYIPVKHIYHKHTDPWTSVTLHEPCGNRAFRTDKYGIPSKYDVIWN